MRCFSILGILVFPACCALASARQGAILDYTVKIRKPEATDWVESGFRLVVTPALVTRNKVKKPRMGGWRIEPLPGKGGVPSASLLARAASLLYFSGPTPGLAIRESGLVLGQRLCRLWQVQVPPGAAAYVYLAEVAPNLLALSYLSASLGEGEFAAMEIHLDKVDLGRQVSPAEDGTVLLRTLRRWGPPAAADPARNAESQESEQID